MTRQHHKSIRFDDAELEQIQRSSKALGMSDAEFIRSACLKVRLKAAVPMSSITTYQRLGVIYQRAEAIAKSEHAAPIRTELKDLMELVNQLRAEVVGLEVEGVIDADRQNL